MAEYAAGVMPRQIEKAVVSEVDEGLSVSPATVSDVQAVFFIKRVENRDIEITRETCFSVRTDPMEADTVIHTFSIPDLFVKTDFEIGVQVTAAVVIRETV